MQADLCFRWAHMSKGTFSYVVTRRVNHIFNNPASKHLMQGSELCYRRVPRAKAAAQQGNAYSLVQ